MAYDGGGESGSGDYEDLSTPAFNSGIGSGAPATLAGGDATQANDALTRQKQWGLLGLYGDNGSLSQYGMGLGSGGGSMQGQIDPTTGMPYSFDPNGGNGGWTLSGDQRNSIGGESGGADSTVDLNNNVNAINGLGDATLSGLGYTGNRIINGTGGDSGDGSRVDPAFAQYLTQNGYQIGSKNDPSDSSGGSDFYNLFQNGKAVGAPNQVKSDDNDFGYAVAAASAAAGGIAGGQLLGASGYGAGTAGAASDIGSLGAAGATAGTTVGAGIPAWAAGAAAGAGAGFGGTAASTGDIGSALKGSAIGGLTGGFTAGVNPAGSLGINDPSWARPINSLVNGTARAGLTGQSVGGAALGSLENSGLSAGLQAGYGGLKSMFGDNGSSGGGSDPYNLSTGNSGMGDQYAPSFGQSMFGGSTPMPSLSNPQPTQQFGDGSIPDYGGSPYAPQNQQQPAPNPFKSAIQTALGMGGTTAASGKSAAPGNFDSMAGNLLQLWQSHRNASQYGGLANNLSSLYGPNSPYAQQLDQALFRQQAASGRRSDVGGRNVQLQAQLAALNSQNAPRLAQLYGAQQNNQGQELQSLLRLGMNPTVQGGISGLWNQYNPFGKPDYNDPGYAAGSDSGNGNGG